MKYAIFEFSDLGEMEVGETSWIAQSDVETMFFSNDRFDFELDIVVNWPTRKGNRGSKPYGAKIVTFGDDKPELTSLLKRILDDNITDFLSVRESLKKKALGRGQREKKRATESSEDLDEEEIQPPKKQSKVNKDARKKESSEILDCLKQRLGIQNPSSSGLSLLEDCQDCVDRDETMAVLQMELEKQQKEIQLLKASLATLGELPTVVRKLKASVEKMEELHSEGLPKITRAESPTFPQDPSEPKNSDLSFDEISQEGPRVSGHVINRCCRDNPQKFVNDMMTAMFDADYLATHSLSGSKSSKATANSETKSSMNKADIHFIIAETQKHFPDRKDSDVRCAIRLKLNNASKLAKRRSLLE